MHTPHLYRQLFPNGVRERGFTPELTDEEALTIGIVGEYLGLSTDKAIYRYFRRHYQAWFPCLKDRTLLVRQWANLWIVEQHLWQAILRQAGALGDAHQVMIPCLYPFVPKSGQPVGKFFKEIPSWNPTTATVKPKTGITLASKGLYASRGRGLSFKPVWSQHGRTIAKVWKCCWQKYQQVPPSRVTKPLWIGSAKRL
jgi:hypothetical protein